AGNNRLGKDGGGEGRQKKQQRADDTESMHVIPHFFHWKDLFYHLFPKRAGVLGPKADKSVCSGGKGAGFAFAPFALRVDRDYFPVVSRVCLQVGDGVEGFGYTGDFDGRVRRGGAAVRGKLRVLRATGGVARGGAADIDRRRRF